MILKYVPNNEVGKLGILEAIEYQKQSIQIKKIIEDIKETLSTLSTRSDSMGGASIVNLLKMRHGIEPIENVIKCSNKMIPLDSRYYIQAAEFKHYTWEKLCKEVFPDYNCEVIHAEAYEDFEEKAEKQAVKKMKQADMNPNQINLFDFD